MAKVWVRINKFISSFFHPKKIWFVLGLSGAGKTYFSEHLANKNDLLHLNIDGPGIDHFNLKAEWDEFERTMAVSALVNAITGQYQKAARSGAVLSFPSDYVISREHIEALGKDVRVVYISGTREDCFRSFLLREEKKPQILPGNRAEHWNMHNEKMLEYIYSPNLIPYRVDAFMENGSRKTVERIYKEAKSI